MHGILQFMCKSICAFMYVCNCICKSNITSHPTLRLNYLHTVDVSPAHAAAAVDEEDKLAVNFPQVWADRLEFRAKVQHDHRVVEDVFMESSVNDIYLEKIYNQEHLAPWDEGFHVTLKEGDKRDNLSKVGKQSISIINQLQIREIPGRVWWAFGVFP